MIIDLGTEEIYIRKSKDEFKKDKRTNMWTLPIQKKEGPRKVSEYPAAKHKKHGKTTTTNNAATKSKKEEETRPCIKVTAILQKDEEEKSEEDSESDMVKNGQNENKETNKNKKHVKNKDDDLKSLEKMAQKDGSDKAKENGIEGWHEYEVQQERQNVVNKMRKSR